MSINDDFRSRLRVTQFLKKDGFAKMEEVAPEGPTNSLQLNAGGSFTGSAELVWDTSTGDGLGIGMHYTTATPQTHLDVNYGFLDDLSNDTGGGESVIFGTGTTVAGKLYYLNSSGVWTETDADAVASGATQLLGIALGTNPANDGILLRGFFQMTTYLQGTWTAGAPIYLSTTAANGDITAPSATGDFVRVVGYCGAGTTDLIYFNPSSTYIEIS